MTYRFWTIALLLTAYEWAAPDALPLDVLAYTLAIGAAWFAAYRKTERRA